MNRHDYSEFSDEEEEDTTYASRDPDGRYHAPDEYGARGRHPTHESGARGRCGGDHRGDNNSSDNTPQAAHGGGEWIEGPCWRMKTPEETKRRQVLRGHEAYAKAERELQKIRASRKYTTPTGGSSVAADGVQGGGARAAPMDNRELRAARLTSVRTKRREQEKSREEADRAAQAMKDAPIRRKLERARRATEKLEAKERLALQRTREMVRSSWERRQVSATKVDSNGQDLESQQIEEAIMNSTADMEDGKGSPSPAVSSWVPGGIGLDFPKTRVYWDPVLDEPTEDESATESANMFPARGRGTAGYWDPVVDGAAPLAAEYVEKASVDDSALRGHGGSIGSGRGGGGGQDWNAAMAEALSVVEWDVTHEILSGSERESLRRTLLTLVNNVLRGDDRRRRVRDNNALFWKNVGRWACGRRLMRLAGFVMERAPQGTATHSFAALSDEDGGEDEEGGRADYVWVANAPNSIGQINMLQCLVEILEAHMTPGTTSTGWNTPLEVNMAELVRGATGALAAGARVSPAPEEHEFTRLRKQQDKEFQEALRQDTAIVAKAAPATTDKENPEDDIDYSQSAGGVIDEGGAGAVVPAPETTHERREKIAASYARLGL